MSELVERLRRAGDRAMPVEDCVYYDAADEIERLRAEVAVLRESAAKLYDIAASGAEPSERRRMLDQMAMESFAEDG